MAVVLRASTCTFVSINETYLISGNQRDLENVAPSHLRQFVGQLSDLLRARGEISPGLD